MHMLWLKGFVIFSSKFNLNCLMFRKKKTANRAAIDSNYVKDNLICK